MATKGILQQLGEASAVVRSRYQETPQIGLVLGSGLGALAESLAEAERIPYSEIPHIPKTTVSGHSGTLCLGRLDEVRVACLQGRVHLYEGHETDKVVFAVRLLAHLGCSAVLLTNAAGGLSPSFHPGTLMLIADHLNLTGHNPLRGPNDDSLGPRFPDMTQAYDLSLRQLAQQTAQEQGIELAQGVYAGLLGPTYETPAEIAMYRTMGADAVGMSTVLEVIALRHMGVRAAAVSCITNMAAGMGEQPLEHTEVEETANRVRDVFVRLMTGWVRKIGDSLQS